MHRKEDQRCIDRNQTAEAGTEKRRLIACHEN